MNVCVVIPAYKCKRHVLGIIEKIGPEVEKIFVIDDACPEQTGEYVRRSCADLRVKVLDSEANRGVGAAVMMGYKEAIKEGLSIAVKIDGDGQMDPALLPSFIRPILEGRADYVKGNRFFELESLVQMPKIRIFGNVGLSFMTKLSSGYWDVFDPTNGYTAIHLNVAAALPFKKISNRYFFETDMLFRLNTLRAKVMDLPMRSRYGDEVSNLKISRVANEFFIKNIRNTFKRIFYNYFLRGFGFPSIALILGSLSLAFGVVFGLRAWIHGYTTNVYSSSGTVMLAALPTILGSQLLLTFFNYDMSSAPQEPIHKFLKR